MKSEQLTQHVVIIGVDSYLNKIYLYKNRFLENIKKLYSSSSKCDDQQQYKATIEENTFSATEVLTNNTPMAVTPLVTLKKPIAIYLLS